MMLFPVAVLVSNRSSLGFLLALLSLMLCSGAPSADPGIRNCNGADFYVDTTSEKLVPPAEWLRIIGYVGGKFFSYAPDHHHQKEDFIRFPIDLAKLVLNDSTDPELFNGSVTFYDEFSFVPLVHLNQAQDGRLVVLEYGQREIGKANGTFQIGKSLPSKLRYSVINRTNPATGLEPWMQILEVPKLKRNKIVGSYAVDNIHMFMHNEKLFINDMLVNPKDDYGNYELSALSEFHPCAHFENPVVEIVPGMKPACYNRTGKDGHEVVAVYRSMHSTKKRCPPNKFKTTYGTAFNMTMSTRSMIQLIDDSGELDCYYMHTPSNGVTCLYAFGSPLLFQGVQVSPSLPVTTPIPPLPYTHRPEDDPECKMYYKEISEHFETFEWVGGCLFWLRGLPKYPKDYNWQVEESDCTPKNDRYHVRRAVFVQSPYEEDRVLMIAEFGQNNNTQIGAAYVKIPEHNSPTNVSEIVTVPDEDDDAYDIENLLGVDLAVTRVGRGRDGDHIFVLQEGKLKDHICLFPKFYSNGDCYIQNRMPLTKTNYTSAEIEAIRTLRQRYEYLNSDPIKKEYSVMGTWAVRYDKSKHADGFHNTLQLFRAPKCTPTVFSLYGRKIFLMPAITTTPPPPLPGLDVKAYIERQKALEEIRKRQEEESQQVRPIFIILTLLCTGIPLLTLIVGCCLWQRRQNRRAAEGYVNDAREAREDHWLIRLFDL